MKSKKQGIHTRLVHAGYHPDATGAVTVPIYQTSTFAFRDARHGAALFGGTEDGYIYTRIGNPTIRALEDAVAELENGFGGIATGSGMGAMAKTVDQYFDDLQQTRVWRSIFRSGTGSSMTSPSSAPPGSR